jgi:hypothetical protein
MQSYRSGIPITVVADRLGLPEREAGRLVEALRRLGIGTLGELAGHSADRVADRFGQPGLRALRLARGEEELLVCHRRTSREELIEEIELPEGTAGDRLERALELLVDRLLAAPRRKERTLLGLRLGARLADGGDWSVDQGLGRPTASRRALRSVLAPRLEDLPAPAISLWLRSLGLGPRAADQLQLAVRGDEARRRRLGAALREVRATQGADSLLKVLPVNAASRIPERRVLLTPLPGAGAMKELGAFRRRFYEAQLVEWSKDDSCCRSKLWLENLEHRNLGGIELEDSPSRTGRRIVHSFSQFDDVEFVDLVRYRHGRSMLGGGEGGYQSWGRDGDGVMPGDECLSAALVDRQEDTDSACHPERWLRPNLLDNGLGHCRCDCPPSSLPILEFDVEHTLPFGSMPLWPEDPFQLALLEPDAHSAGEWVSNSRWPRHRADARDRDFTCVRLRSILRIIFHTSLERVI